MDVTELIEMFEVMAELEALCCRLAARRVSEQQLDQLQQLNDACVVAQQQGDPDGYYYANEKFHRGIYELSGNAFLAEQARQLSLKLRPYRRLQLRIRNRIAASSREHASKRCAPPTRT
jgi:DNA-binding GntR family transcriptional regulator